MGRMCRGSWMTLAALAVMTIGGCAPPKASMAESRQEARERWAESRSQIMYSMAKQQFEASDLDKAEKSIVQALSIDPEQAAYHELAARILMERGELEKAFHTLDRAISLNPDRAESHYYMGIVLQRWQRYDGALERYEAAYRLAPDQVSNLLAVGEMMVKLGRADAAIARLTEKMPYFEHNAAIRVAIGRLHMLQRDFPNAVDRLREASLLAPEDVTITEHLALAELAAGHHSEAAYRLKLLLAHEHYADREDLRLALGDCYVALNKLQDARAIYIEMTRNQPDDVRAWMKLGEVSVMGGDRVRLAESARRVLALAPQRYEGYMFRGIHERDNGQIDAALASFDRASQIASGNAQPLILKGMTLEQSGDRQGAAEAYQQALRVAPEDERPRRLLAALAG